MELEEIESILNDREKPQDRCIRKAISILKRNRLLFQFLLTKIEAPTKSAKKAAPSKKQRLEDSNPEPATLTALNEQVNLQGSQIVGLTQTVSTSIQQITKQIEATTNKLQQSLGATVPLDHVK